MIATVVDVLGSVVVVVDDDAVPFATVSGFVEVSVVNVEIDVGFGVVSLVVNGFVEVGALVVDVVVCTVGVVDVHNVVNIVVVIRVIGGGDCVVTLEPEVGNYFLIIATIMFGLNESQL